MHVARRVVSLTALPLLATVLVAMQAFAGLETMQSVCVCTVCVYGVCVYGV
jgi:hypothetical protein